jgi:hypothetical protein
MASRRGRNRKRQHTYRGPKDRPGIKFAATHRCPECGKWCYQTRNSAEKAVSQIHPGATVHYYICRPELGGTWWHFTSMTADQVGDIRARQTPPEDDWDDPEETLAG